MGRSIGQLIRSYPWTSSCSDRGSVVIAIVCLTVYWASWTVDIVGLQVR